MPVFTDFNNFTTMSSSFYYSPYSLSSRMSNALYSSPSSSKYSPVPAPRPVGYYHPPRPIYIDTTTIDLSAPRLPIRKPNAPAIYGKIHRGRTVIRLKMPPPPPPPSDGDSIGAGGLRSQKSPGRKLVEKFTIREPSKGNEDANGIASGGIIRRHLSGGRRKPSLATEVPIPSSRKSSVSEELLKEEEAIFDSLIMEEIKRTNGVPDRRNSFDGFMSDFSRQSSRRKSKRYSVDFNAGRGIANSESLNDFIEKLNADIARSPSATFSPTEKCTPLVVPPIPEETESNRPTSEETISQSATTESKTKNEPAMEEKSIAETACDGKKISGDTTVDTASNLSKINYDVIVEESPNLSSNTSFTFVCKTGEAKKTKDDQRKLQIKQNACETLKTQVAITKELIDKRDVKSPVKLIPKSSDQTVEKVAEPKNAHSVEKTIQKKEIRSSEKPKNVTTKPGEKIQPEKKVATKPSQKRTQTIQKEGNKKMEAKSHPNELRQKTDDHEDGSSVGAAKGPKKVADVKCNKGAEKRQPKNAKERCELDAKNKGKAMKKDEIKKASSGRTSNKSANRKSTLKKSENGTDANNNRISRNSQSKEEGVVENGQGGEETHTSTKKKRREINWKMVDVGRADFDDEITELNGWSPEEDSDGGSVYTSEEDSSTEESGSDEETDESSSSASPSRTSSNQDLNIDGISIDGGNCTRRPYSYRHRIVHTYEGRIVTPASTIPRFKKYTVHDFNFVKVLGKGSFGKVLLAELKGTEYYYAVKCLKKDVVLEDDDVECTLIERKVLTLSTKHPYLCHLFCTFQTQSHLFFVMEYLNGGDLMFHIQQSGRFDEGRARFYAAEIVSGLRFLHRKGIVYRDLKLDNILLDCHGHVRIADFGMCKLQIYLDRTADTFCGTPDYMAPEIIKGLKYNQCVDWWSFGILLYEMLIGQSPFSGCDEDQLFWSICNEKPQYPRYLSVQAKSILMALLEKESNKRLGSLGCNSGDDVMAHDFFRGLEWSRLERKDLEPPYKPRVFHPLETHYFDRTFTKEKPRLTPIEKTILESMDQSQFQGFSYTNPNATDC